MVKADWVLHSVSAGKWLEHHEHLAIQPNHHAGSQLSGKTFCVRSTDGDGLERATVEKLVLAAGGSLAGKRAATHVLVVRAPFEPPLWLPAACAALYTPTWYTPALYMPTLYTPTLYTPTWYTPALYMPADTRARRSSPDELQARRDLGDEAAANQELVDQPWLFNQLVEGGGGEEDDEEEEAAGEGEEEEVDDDDDAASHNSEEF